MSLPTTSLRRPPPSNRAPQELQKGAPEVRKDPQWPQYLSDGFMYDSQL
jgi:hypothetical protein